MLVLAETDAATGAQLGAHGGEVTLIAAARRGLLQRRGHPFGGPLVHHDQQPLAVGAGAGLHQVDAVDVCRLADQSEHAGDRGAHVGRLEQQPARLRRSSQQPLARPQRLVDARQRLCARRGQAFRFQQGDSGVHLGRPPHGQRQGGKCSATRTPPVRTDPPLYLKGERGNSAGARPHRRAPDGHARAAALPAAAANQGLRT